ncbi:MAG: hypothetical protein OJF51_000273 [Nitrospira sp.]|nr:MAG: hypothetical protein OJF51_000273 [Nitrospira sp.]
MERLLQAVGVQTLGSVPARAYRSTWEMPHAPSIDVDRVGSCHFGCGTSSILVTYIPLGIC